VTAPTTSTASPGSGQGLPRWSRVMAVVAHPDDESFGLGALLDLMARAGAAVNVLCFTHGEVSTLNETGCVLHEVRASELRQASAELGVARIDLLDYGDGKLDRASCAELAGVVLAAVQHCQPDGLLVFDETGITGHPDHRAATAAALEAGRKAGLPVLAWALPEAVASQLREETSQPFAGWPPESLDVSVRVSRSAQRRAALAHASQLPPGTVLWRRLELLGDREYLRWLH
jgi:N-acetylglucosamine malate deacetylase 2